MKRLQRFLGVLAIVGAIGGLTAATMAYSNVTGIGTFWRSTAPYDTARGWRIGGETRVYRDSTDTLLVGDVVYLSRSNTIHKSATLANYNTIAGVVVGGTVTGMQGARDSANVGDTATLAHGTVLVLKCGRTWIKPDSGLSPGAQLLPSTATAGQAHARIAAAVVDTFNRAYGQLVDSGVSGVASLANICVRY